MLIGIDNIEIKTILWLNSEHKYMYAHTTYIWLYSIWEVISLQSNIHESCNIQGYVSDMKNFSHMDT